MSELPIRRPAVAGMFYPGDPTLLRRTIQEYLDEATLPAELGAVRAVIAPHAGYIYSGPTAGYAFKALATLAPRNWTVYLLGPAHRVGFKGVALGAYSAYRTPLGDVPIAAERVTDMLTRSQVYVRSPEAHAQEHCLEVEVPFLQMALHDFQMVPMLFGNVDAHLVAAELAENMDEDDLIVVSSDLSHYYPYARARDMDLSLLEALLAEDRSSVERGEACGRIPAVVLMDIARRRQWRPYLLDYRNSGDTAGDRRQVVGYASVAYTE